MRGLDRISLLETIGGELQSRMTYSDIDAYLSGFGVDCKKQTSGINSKRVYTKELLADAPEEVILKIADELGIEHGYSTPHGLDLSDSKFWLPSHFRMFLSHISAFKVQTSRLQKALRKYGVSAFVAHEDIEPTKEWLIEIEKALFSMDALVAILTPGFKESKWTDHEVGIAVGRGVLVIPIRKGLDPYGFIGKFQGLPGNGKTVSEVADAVFEVVIRNRKTRTRMVDCLVELLLFARDEQDAKGKLALLGRVESISTTQLEKLRANVLENDVLRRSDDFVRELDALLQKHGMPPLARDSTAEPTIDSDLPF